MKNQGRAGRTPGGAALPWVIAATILMGGALAWWLAQSRDPRRQTVPFRVGFQLSPPHQYIDKNGRPYGFLIDVFSTAAHRANIPFEWVHCPDPPQVALPAGKVDIWPLLVDTPARRRLIYITKPWERHYYWLVVPANAGIRSPADVGRRAVLLRTDEIGRRIAQEAFPQATLVSAPDNYTILTAMLTGKASVGIVSGSKDFLGGLKPAYGDSRDLRFYPLAGNETDLAVGASLARPDAQRAADRIREEIGRMSKDGTLASIAFKWYFDPNTETADIFDLDAAHRNFHYLWGAVGILTVVLGLLAWQSSRYRSAKRAAEEASHAKSDFLAKVSHEVRTPMNSVIGLTDVLLGTPLAPDQREMASLILRGAEGLLGIINEILDLSKIEAGKMDIDASEFDLRRLLDETIRLLAPRAMAKQLALTCEVDPAVPSALIGDAGRIRQVLNNLVSNAIKFTDRGRITVEARPVGAPAPGRARFRVEIRDTGIGIAREAHGALFRPFSQVGGSANVRAGGTGLGLVISRQLVELMGGVMGFASEAGRGSTFWFELSLPLAVAQPVEAPAPPTATVSEAPGSGLRLLVAEDNRSNQLVAGLMLRQMGHSVDIAGDGVAALEFASRHRYDAILMDCQMPEMDGFEATRRIRQGVVPGIDRRIPIIGLTAYAMADARDKCLAAGMDDCVSKPVRAGQLRDALARCGILPDSGLKRPDSVWGRGAPGGGTGEPTGADGGAKPESQTQSAGVLDLVQLNTLRNLPGRSGGSLLPELVESFVHEQVERLSRIEALADERAAVPLAEIAHSMAGSCAHLGAAEMQAQALALERLARAGRWPEVGPCVESLRQAWDRLQMAMADHQLVRDESPHG